MKNGIKIECTANQLESLSEIIDEIVLGMSRGECSESDCFERIAETLKPGCTSEQQAKHDTTCKCCEDCSCCTCEDPESENNLEIAFGDEHSNFQVKRNNMGVIGINGLVDVEGEVKLTVGNKTVTIKDGKVTFE